MTEKARKLFGAVGTARRWKARPDTVSSYLKFCGRIADKAEASLAELERAGASEAETASIRRSLDHARRQIDQVDRRLLKGEAIPHDEKVFPVFEEHTRWISKGKAGRPVELGVPLRIVEDRHRFILEHRIMWKGGDVDIAAPLLESCLKAYPDIAVYSFDRGFHSPGNQERLGELPETAALAKKGHPTVAKAHRRHPAVESAINNLERRGLDRVRTRGAAGFERTVGLSILAANLHRSGLIAQRRERKRLGRLRKRGLRLAA